MIKDIKDIPASAKQVKGVKVTINGAEFFVDCYESDKKWYAKKSGWFAGRACYSGNKSLFSTRENFLHYVCDLVFSDTMFNMIRDNEI